MSSARRTSAPSRWASPDWTINGATLTTGVRIDRRSLLAGLLYGVDGLRIGGTRRPEIAPHLAIRWTCLSRRGPERLAAAMVSAVLISTACSETAVARRGPPQQRVVARTYDETPEHVRAEILEAFGASRSQLPEPFRQLTANALTPPLFSPDGLLTVIDPGGYLDPYKRMSPDEKANDVLIQDPTGDVYWDSEYRTADPVDRLVRFRCGFLVHLSPRGRSNTEVQVYELVPSVWVGEHWAFAAHGVGVGRYRDIRFVEPTVTDRVETLDLVDRVLKN